MVRYLGIFLALVLTGTAMPVAFSYQGEDQKGPVSKDDDKFSFNGFSNGTQFSFNGFSNGTQFSFNGTNSTNQGQEISFLMHEINYLKKELANLIKEQKKD